MLPTLVSVLVLWLLHRAGNTRDSCNEEGGALWTGGPCNRKQSICLAGGGDQVKATNLELARSRQQACEFVHVSVCMCMLHVCVKTEDSLPFTLRTP